MVVSHPFCSRLEADRVINSWMAALNGRQAGWLLCTNTGFGILAAVPGEVLKLIMISDSLQMKMFFSEFKINSIF